MIEFAQNPNAPQLAVDIIGRIQSRADLNWAALIDTAFDRHKTAFPLPDGSLCCYREGNGVVPSPLATLRAIAPCIVPIARERAATLVTELLAHCNARPMLSFVAVPQTVSWETLVEQWEPLHWVIPPDGERLLLRFADTRTLAILPQTLKPQQWHAWSKGIDSWLFVNRFGTLQALPLPEEKYPPLKRFTIDDAQFAAFVEEADADATLNYLHKHYPMLIPETLTGYDYYILACQTLETARQHNVEGFMDRSALIILNIRRNGTLTDMPELIQLLQERKWETGELGSTLLAQPWINPPATEQERGT